MQRQVVYALYNAVEQGILPTTKTVLQAYKPDSRYSRYFNVGYQSRVMLSAARQPLARAPRYMALLVTCLTAHVLLC